MNEKKLGRISDYNKTLPVLELYTCLQSEGSRFGRPNVLIRTTGCTHRCYFGEGGWCDSWQTSIHPEKGKFTFNDIIKMYDDNPQIHEMMITGGSPTMHGDLVNELMYFAHERGIFVTIETEGSHFLPTDHPIDLISLSPKFANSIPQLGVLTPQGKPTDQKMIDQHNKFRLNYEPIRNTLAHHKDYHFKPVWDGTEGNLEQIEAARVFLDIPKNKTFIMPAGDNRDELIRMYPLVFEMCTREGYNMTGRDHIIAYNKERYV
jgi:7-carboxy-7-deazaguanine synthase